MYNLSSTVATFSTQNIALSTHCCWVV